jgi:hypothetical protein
VDEINERRERKSRPPEPPPDYHVVAHSVETLRAVLEEAFETCDNVIIVGIAGGRPVRIQPWLDDRLHVIGALHQAATVYGLITEAEDE